MKVLTKRVLLDNKEYVLITDTHDGRKFYGTIDYDYLDGSGKLTKPISGHDMAISFENPADAIQNRIDHNKVEAFKAEGHPLNEVLAFVACGYTVDALDYAEMCKKFEVTL